MVPRALLLAAWVAESAAIHHGSGSSSAQLLFPRRGSALHRSMATEQLSSGPAEGGNPPPKPSASQLAYQEREFGSLISFNMVNFWPEQLNSDRPFTLAPASAFTPQQLDADQWAEGLASMGARYSLILAKDESGFLLWPTQFKWEGKLYNYTVRESPLRPKGRDIIKEYVTAAKKKGVETVTLPPAERPRLLLRGVGLAGHLLPALGQLPPQRHARGRPQPL